jgi:hypothetical protein
MGARQMFLAVAVATCALICALPTPARASATQQSILMDDDQLIYASPAHVGHTLAEVASLGVDRVKVSVVWSLVAPDPTSSTKPKFDATDPAAYPPGAWDRYDTVVRLAQALGMRTYFQFTPSIPTWAIDRSLPGGQGLPLGRAPDPHAFEQFVEAVGRRYSGTYAAKIPVSEPPPSLLGLPISLTPPQQQATKPGSPIPPVAYWGIWNEPNFPSWLNPWYRRLRGGLRQYTQPMIYRNLVNAAVQGLTTTGHSADTILLGETANFGNLSPIPFIEDLYCVSSAYRPLTGRAATKVGCPTSGDRASFVAHNRGLFAISGYAHHPYGFDMAPDRPYPQRGWLTLQNLGVLERVLNGVFAGYGDSRPGGMPLYLSEWGYKTNPPNPYVKTSLTQQAAWLDEGEYMTWKVGYVRALAQFLLVDDQPKAGEPVGSRKYWHTFQTGLETMDGKPKPSLAAFRIPIWLPDARRGPRVTVWGQLRPANHAVLQYGEIQYRRAGQPQWSTIRQIQTTSPEGFVLAHVPIRAAGSVRLGWLDIGGGTVVYSRSMTIR